jgi:hypothetical protein
MIDSITGCAMVHGNEIAWRLEPHCAGPVAMEDSVGAGLLANAVCQSTFMLFDTPHSRASPLPQVLCRHILSMSRTRYLLGGIGSLAIPVQASGHTLIYGKTWIWPIWRNARLNP